MGGIKNREEKRKAAKVFSSAGGGGTKGPAVLDKRNQEQKCPHCDRTFKQDARLKDHIAKQHAELLPTADAAAAASSSRAPPPAAAAGPSSRPPSAAPTTSAASKQTAAASSSSTPPSTSSSTAAAGGAAAGGRMMDVNSRGGYYSEKSPKLLLYEWCQRQKRPRPKFKVVPQQQQQEGQADGPVQYRCRVVLPDPKLPGTDKDLMVWLPQQHAAAGEEEAEQRGAVAALHAVAGDRSMDYLLPKGYRPLWGSLGQEAQERAARAVASKARDEARRDREAQRAQHAARKAPTSVIMSDKQRQMVDGLLKNLTLDDGATAGSSSSRDLAPLTSDQQQLVEQLEQLGFARPDAEAGVRAAVSNSNLNGGEDSWEEEEEGSQLELQPVLDWLCLHVPEARLPAAFGPGASKPVSVLRKQGGSSSSAANSSSAAAGGGGGGAGATAASDPSVAAAEAAGSCLEDPHVLQLLGWGYPLQPAMAALEEAAGKLQEALQLLYCQLAAEQSTAVAGLTGGPGVMYSGEGELGEAWVEEVEVMGAIYDSHLQQPEPGHLEVSLECDAVTSPVRMLVWCPRGAADGAAYPEVPPLLAVSSSELAPSVRCHLTQQLAEASSSLLGEPMIHTLAVQLQELLQGPEQLAALEGSWPKPFNAPAVGQPSQTESPGDAADQEQQEGAAADAAEQILHRSSSRAGLAGEGGSRGARGKRERPQHLLPPSEAAAESRRLQQQQERLQADPSHAKMRGARARLPAAASRGEVLGVVGGGAVTIICGATGCGKSTQVPQYLLEEAISGGRGGVTNIIVTQPRRIAALGLAARVAAERGEAVGGSVGYSVRLDSKVSSRTRILFCTTGILLRRLMSDPSLPGVTHLVLDEVHERGTESDLLLLLLRQTLAARTAAAAKAGGRGGVAGEGVPKLLLMSATADAELFAEYFRKSPLSSLPVGVVSIPGFTHPVRQMWLEDALEVTGVSVGERSRYARRKAPSARPSLTPQQQHEQQAAAAAAAAAAADPPDDPDEDDDDALPGSGSASQQPVNPRPLTSYSAGVQRSLQVLDAAQINSDLIEALLAHIVEQMARKGPGALLQGWSEAPPLPPSCDARAVLIFMPGAPEIDALCRQLNSSGRLAAAAGGSSNLRVLPLHGSLPAAQQARVFESVGRGVTKIVVATNVAETSVTIDDIAVVIDTCRLKEMRYDPSRGLSRLAEAWVSQAAAQQRKGRAGRVQPGTCYRLLPSELWGRLAGQQAPEVLRVPLEQLCLATKAALAAAATAAADGGGGGDGASSRGAAARSGGGGGGGTGVDLFQGLQGAKLQDILGQLLTPPDPASIEAAVLHLTRLGALAPADESLTPLGRHLVAMPMDADLGKALIYGCMLRCTGPLLTIAAAAAYGRSVWVSPADKRAAAEAAKRTVAAAAYAQRSDHLAIVAAYNGWLTARAAGGRRDAAEYCNKSFLSYQAMESIHASRLDYAATLTALGFLPDWYTSHLKQEAVHGPAVNAVNPVNGQRLTKDEPALDSYAAEPGGPDEYSHNARVVKAALVAGFYPRLLRVESPPAKYAKVEGGAMRTEHEARQLKFFERKLGRVFLHPSSACFPAGSFPSGWLVYSQLVETGKAYVREASMAPVYGLLMCGGELEVLHTEGLLVLDGWARFKAPARIGVLLQQLRAAVAALLAAKLEDPGLSLAGHRVVDALHALLATDGF